VLFTGFKEEGLSHKASFHGWDKEAAIPRLTGLYHYVACGGYSIRLEG